jgi:hypothetical protein
VRPPTKKHRRMTPASFGRELTRRRDLCSKTITSLAGQREVILECVSSRGFLETVREECTKHAVGHFGADVVGVLGLVVEVGVGVEGDGGSCVSEDA